ncbi:hypothetical protein [Streptomyces sp. NPDC053048]|uniref:hypothetical protein n=1 Tax=Streptomyces sp. NPDC053048 TaxID=3365694 RepID=UPI0037D7575A
MTRYDDIQYSAALIRHLQERCGFDRAHDMRSQGLHAAEPLLGNMREILGHDYAPFLACAVEGFHRYQQAGGAEGSRLPYLSYVHEPVVSVFGNKLDDLFTWACALLQAQHTILGTRFTDGDIETFLSAAADAAQDLVPMRA